MIVTPDGARYLAMGAGKQEPIPFHLRWLMPKLLKDHLDRWLFVSWGAVALCPILIACIGHQRGFTPAQSIAAAMLWLGLPSVRLLVRAPVLVDAAATACLLASVVLAPVNLYAAVSLALLSGCISERAPIFAALFAWNPWLLLGLVAPLVRYFTVAAPKPSQSDPLRETLEHPFLTGLRAHAGNWRNAFAMLTPWGACLAALYTPDIRWLAPAGVAYAQLLVATDAVRLYQAAAPAVCLAAALVIPPEFVVIALVAHWWNPWAGNGV